MSLSGLIKLVTKAFKFTISRPIQRFNIENRAKKYLGPDASKFKPAPRAIGPIAGRSLKQLSKPSTPPKNVGLLLSDEIKKPFSETEDDDKMVINSSNKLQVNKTVTQLNESICQNNKLITANENKKSHRPLPKLTNLQLSDPASIWTVNKTPPGRLNLIQLQEIMIYNMPAKLASEKFGIKEEYAETLIKSMKQVRVLVSPRLSKLLDYTNRDNKLFQETKNLIYFEDKTLRSDIDKSIDETFLPDDKLDPEIRELLDASKEAAALVDSEKTKPRITFVADEVFRRPKRLAKRPEPLRISPANETTAARPALAAPLPATSKETPKKLNSQKNKLLKDD